MYHAGRIKNSGNLKWAPRWCNIPYAMSLSIEEIYFRLKACVNQCNKSTYATIWRPPRRRRMRMLNDKTWQLFNRRKTGASGDISNRHLASHGQEHASKYRLSKVKEWKTRSTARRIFMRQFEQISTISAFILPWKLPCSQALEEVCLVTMHLLPQTRPFWRAHKRKGHGVHFLAPVLDISGQFVRGLFVDNTDL